jgi:hypothetical protein
MGFESWAKAAGEAAIAASEQKAIAARRNRLAVDIVLSP